MSPTAQVLRHVFDSTVAGTVGLEEEVFLTDRQTHLPIPLAQEIIAAVGDGSLKEELPACQIEIVTRPHAQMASLIEELRANRLQLLDGCSMVDVAPMAAAVHPRVASVIPSGICERYRSIENTFGEVARRQMVGSLQVHVALGSASCALAVYNALRAYLPEIAALAASSPFSEGRDTGFASVRPIVAAQLPRQGIPPILPSWEDFADDLSWGQKSGMVPTPNRWWWELRPHPRYGTLEVRVPDVQATAADAHAVAATVYALVRRLAHSDLEGEPLPCHPSWRIAENSWSALRDGTHGQMADLVSGETSPTEKRLHHLIDEIEPFAEGDLDSARALVACNGADQLRRVGLERASDWLCEVFAC